MRILKEYQASVEQGLTALQRSVSDMGLLGPNALAWSWKTQFYGNTKAFPMKPRTWCTLSLSTALVLHRSTRIVAAAYGDDLIAVSDYSLGIRPVGDFALLDGTGAVRIVSLEDVAETLPGANPWALLVAQKLAKLLAQGAADSRSYAETNGDVMVSFDEAIYWLACDSINSPYSTKSLWDDPSVCLEVGDRAAMDMAEAFTDWLADRGWTRKTMAEITDMGSRRLADLENQFGEWRAYSHWRSQRHPAALVLA